jgi:hypothetical protein
MLLFPSVTPGAFSRLLGCPPKGGRLIQEFVERMGVALNQYSVFVLAFPSDSFLLEIAVTRKTRKKT